MEAKHHRKAKIGSDDSNQIDVVRHALSPSRLISYAESSLDVIRACDQPRLGEKYRKILPESTLHWKPHTPQKSRGISNKLICQLTRPNCMKEQMVEILTLEQVAGYLKVMPPQKSKLFKKRKAVEKNGRIC
ncbi:hypothetical protein SAMN05421882_101436 [Nitrosomonas communis]|uniref:Uncharacterized protein n=1 Tax=Nitrosomonas communis TaxID=44574 RepID=A0A1H2U562_9PROT|nr:hypothetical protein SAMN05421882_101436 [Nitrosomonas communis]